MGYVPVSVVAALRGEIRLGVFFRLGTTPALHLAFGVNDVPITIPSIDPAGTIYQGGGAFLNVPDLEILINGLADKVTFQLNGLSPAQVTDLLRDAPPVLGARATIGIAPLDVRYQPLCQIVPLWTGTADFIAEEMKPQPDLTKNRTMSIMLTCMTGDTTRSAPNLTSYADAIQKARFPDDRFFERIVRYIPGLLVAWPR